MTESTALTFEEGYTRLQTISARVTSEEVPVAEMCELFAEGKGLQSALTEYLDEQKSRVEAIERGQGIQAFRIVAPTADASSESEHPEGDGSEFASGGSDFELPATPAAGAADDDIPF